MAKYTRKCENLWSTLEKWKVLSFFSYGYTSILFFFHSNIKTSSIWYTHWAASPVLLFLWFYVAKGSWLCRALNDQIVEICTNSKVMTVLLWLTSKIIPPGILVMKCGQLHNLWRNVAKLHPFVRNSGFSRFFTT